METNFSKNVANAPIYAGVSAIIGDGNTVINLKEAGIYKELEAELAQLDKQCQITRERIAKYSTDGSFKEELHRLEERRTAAEEELAALKREVIKLAESFSMARSTERLMLAMSYVEAGDFRKASEVLEERKMVSELDALLEEQERLRQRKEGNAKLLRDKASEFLIKAQLTNLDFKLPNRFQKAKELYRKSLSAERNSKNLFDFALFLQEHNELNEARALYQEALEQLRELAKSDPSAYCPKIGDTLNNLGNLLVKNNQPDEAELAYREALDVREDLAKENQELLPRLAESLNNYGNFLEENGKLPEAERSYRKSLEIRRELAANAPDTYLPRVAETLNGLGLLFVSKGEPGKADEAFREAIDLYVQYMDAIPSLMSNMAGTLVNLGNLLTDHRKFEPARLIFDSAIEACQELVSRNRQTHLPLLVTTLLGQMRLFIGEFNLIEAEKAGLSAINNCRELAGQAPQAFLPQLAVIAKNMSGFYLNYAVDRGKSLAYAQEAARSALPFENTMAICKKTIGNIATIVDYWGIDAGSFLSECRVSE
ncbi:tetratricopeptide repeat protein [Rufibacter latericius]|nr:tetratricopeptide repeat protein [Rufibacter latericius]